jgi:hypothetical protein
LFDIACSGTRLRKSEVLNEWSHAMLTSNTEMTPATNDREHNDRELTDVELLEFTGGTGGKPNPGSMSWEHYYDKAS